ncbi:Rho guanine nucleotide exchange factor scd1 [Ceratocystis fimbriata CBS 114723]|uniref:Rho guanine nucleotide exchange factor scd1 n=1 Tax=Ceratocystis fimbriata CBS 114723 TaxID=1035309 RepID=A0A2C5X8C1_9PEZI|nr:Rho guanine nucleotide exchange factor scd1 [Ceratocystis fimbriata CBS 114723]
MAHAPLIRNDTAPLPLFSRDRKNSIAGLMSAAPRISGLSGTTLGSSETNLSSTTTTGAPNSTPTSIMAMAGNPMATANIINQKADASRSLYQICRSLKQRLALVPGFEPYLQQLDPNEPVDSLWEMFRTGLPLLTIYNALQQGEIKIEDSIAVNKRPKMAVFRFVQACLKDLNIPAAECFVINDVLGNDTTGFVKVTQVVNLVLDLAEQKGLLYQPQTYPEEDAMAPTEAVKMSYTDYVIRELVDTERKYVQDLENLFDLKNTLEQKGVITGDVVHSIFLNINFILDFQRRFLIRVETTNSMPQTNQRWGSLFANLEESFDIYLPFIANQGKAAELAGQVFDKIQSAEHPVAIDFNTLDGFLLKPMQRLVKYPLLLKDLLKKSEDEAIKQDLQEGIDAAERVLFKANEAVNVGLLDEARNDLMSRVDDWRSHKVEQFGKLLMHGTHPVITGKNDQEREYEIYLFDAILLCCKEATPAKSKDKKDRTRSTGPKPKGRNTAKLHLKGRIFMSNVTEVVTLSKPGSYSVQIWWRGDPGIEYFTVKFANEEQLKKWSAALDKQRKECETKTATEEAATTEFNWMRSQNIENPYKEEGNDDDEDTYNQTTYGSHQSSGMLSRNASSTNIRARSATGDSSQSLNGMSRGPAPRFPVPSPGLSIQTQSLTGMNRSAALSPGERGGIDSYFSPVGESPVSMRTSTTSGSFPTPSTGYPSFQRTGTPQSGWEDSNRYTAPPGPRAPSRDGNGSRTSRGPTPVNASSQRSRSYSTPDIANQPGMRRNTAGTIQAGGIPAVPGIPAHLHHDGINRSQSGSPRNDIPIRTNTASPGTSGQQFRGHAHKGSYGGQMGQFPSQPTHRQGTPGSTNGSFSGVPGGSFSGAPSGSFSGAPGGGSDYRTVSPPTASAGAGNGATHVGSPEIPNATQLKVRVNCDGGTYFTLVAGFNITYQTLVDRIDAKLARFMTATIGRGQLKLRYRDEDGDFVRISSDDDIQIAFMEWRESMRNSPAGVGEIELFCTSDT